MCIWLDVVLVVCKMKEIFWILRFWKMSYVHECFEYWYCDIILHLRKGWKAENVVITKTSMYIMNFNIIFLEG